MELQHRAGLAVDGTEVVAGRSGQGREAATEVDDPSVRRGLQGVDRATQYGYSLYEFEAYAADL